MRRIALPLAPPILAFLCGAPPARAQSPDAVAPAARSAGAINPLDAPYGAKCDGSTPDSAAFQKALDTGRNVVVPAKLDCVVGDLLLTSSNQSLSSERSILTAAPGATAVIRLQGFNNKVRGFYINDTGGTTNRTVLSAAAAAGATSISVAEAAASGSTPGALVDQRIDIRLDGGSHFTTWITSVSRSRIGLLDALPGAASPGNSVWSTFGLVHVENAAWWRLEDITTNGAFGAINLDDPGSTGAYRGVSKGTVRNLRIIGSRIFGIIKGRNAHDNTIGDAQVWGGWHVDATATGDGARTVFALPEQVNLRRELAVTVAGATAAIGADYAIAANGLAVTFARAPAQGAAIRFGFQAYGAEGYLDDGRGSGVVGGNSVAQLSVLQVRRGIVLKRAQGYGFDEVITDTNSEACVVADATSSAGEFTNTFLGWCPVEVSALGNAVGFKLSGTSTLVPAAYPVSGVAGTLAAIASGSTPDIAAEIAGGGIVEYRGGVLFRQVDARGNTAFGSACPGNFGSIGRWLWCGSTGAISISPLGTVLSFGYRGYNYVAANAPGGTLDLQAKGSGGRIRREAAAADDLLVGGVDVETSTPTLKTVGVEARMLAAEDHALSVVTASFTFDAAVFSVTAGSGARALAADLTGTLPACDAATRGREYLLAKGDGSTHTVTLAAAPGDTIAGTASATARHRYETLGPVQCNGAGLWQRMHPTPSQQASAITAGDGTFAITWARPLQDAQPAVQLTSLGGGTAPQITICQADTSTATRVTGHCSTTRTAASPGTAPVVAASGVTVMATVADRTQ